MKIFFRGIALLSIVTSFPALPGSIIKCQAVDGSITFADTRCPTGQTQLSKKTFQVRKAIKQSSNKELAGAAEYPADKTPPKMMSYLFQSRFAQVLNSISVIKLSINEYYLYRGRWPGKLEDLGFKAEDMTSSLIDATAVSKEGRIHVQLNQEFGENKEVWLYPELIMAGTQIEWACYTNFPAAMLTSGAGLSLCNSRYF